MHAGDGSRLDRGWCVARSLRAYASYQFANLSESNEPPSILVQLLSRQDIAAAVERARLEAEAGQRNSEEWACKLAEAMFAPGRRPARPPVSPEQVALRLAEARARVIATETPEERVRRVCSEAVDDVVGAANARLLVRAHVSPSDEGSRAVLHIELTCTEVALGRVLGDPVVARVLDDLERRIREGLPGTQLDTRRISLSLSTLPGDHAWTASALTEVGATAALAALGLAPRHARDSKADAHQQDLLRIEIQSNA